MSHTLLVCCTQSLVCHVHSSVCYKNSSMASLTVACKGGGDETKILFGFQAGDTAQDMCLGCASMCSTHSSTKSVNKSPLK